MADPIRNFFKSTLVGTYSNTDTSFTIATGDGALLPDPATDGAFNLVVFEGTAGVSANAFEIVRVTAKSGDVLTVTREQEGTTALTIGATTHSIILSATKKTFDDKANTVGASLTGVETITFTTDGDGVLELPKGTFAQRPASPQAGYTRYNTEAEKIEFYDGTIWKEVTTGSEVAEGVEYLVIAGGGGGGGNGGGGGGAGGYRSSVTGESSGGGASAESKLDITTGTAVTVTVGGGGSGYVYSPEALASTGSNSVFSTITSTGGGTGGYGAGDNATSGGSGGGGSRGNQSGASGTSNQGYAGGNGGSNSGAYPSGGGGGAGAVGGNAVSSTTGGDGGDGVESNITGTPTYRAGGGGGSATNANGSGGLGGGGDAANGTGLNGTANTGGGGGGGDGLTSPYNGGSGGSGVVILKYPDAYTITVGAGLTSSTSSAGGYKVTTFTAGDDTISFSL